MLVAVLGAVAFLAGAAMAYAGRAKPLVTTSPFPTAFFGIGWMAAGALLVMLAGQLGGLERTLLLRVVVGVLGLTGLALFAVGLLGLLWMPLPLTPPWYRGWVARGRRWDDYAGPEHMPAWQRRLADWQRRKNEERRRRAGG